MASMLCVQEEGGFIEHNHKTLSASLLRDSTNHAIFTKYFPADLVRQNFYARRPFSTPNPQVKTDHLDERSLISHSMKLQNWLNKKSVKVVQEKSDLEAKPVKELYGNVLHEEESFVRDVQDMVAQHDYLNLRKKELLHKHWSERVYEPLRKVIIGEMDGEAYSNYKFRKDQIYREYISHVNKKGHVFRDDFDPQEYYALGLHANRPMVIAGMQACTPALQDPTILQERNWNAEEQMLLKCTSGAAYNDKSLEKVRLPTLPLVPLGRHGTEVETWTAMHENDVESPVRQASRRRMQGVALKSQIDFGQWSTEKYGQDTVTEELGIQRRRPCKQPPFTLPKAKGVVKKLLPAAEENLISRSLPLASSKDLFECSKTSDKRLPNKDEPQSKDCVEPYNMASSEMSQLHIS